MNFSFIKDPAPMVEQPQGAVPSYRITTTEVYRDNLKAYMPCHVIECKLDDTPLTRWAPLARYANKASAEVVVEALRATAGDTTWSKYHGS